MPKYDVSSFDQLYVIDEELKYLPIIRQAFASITGLVGIVTLVRFLIVLKSKTSPALRFINIFKTTGGKSVLVYIISHLIHSIHYVDNIIRPVDYIEPKWLYQKYLISEMEINFFVNFPITFSGLYFMERLVSAINKEKHSDIANACKKMTSYLMGSLLTLDHYRIEPPWRYEPFVNFTITGEGFATIVLSLLLYQLRRQSLAKANSFDLEQITGLLDDEQGQSEFDLKVTGVRSRTPVKH